MACARMLMLLMLPGMAPLLVRGLQVEPTASSTDAALPLPRTFRPHHAKEKKRALLILAGLARHMEATWPALEKAVVAPNEEAGYTFSIIFSTNANLECNRESPKWFSRRCEEPSSDPTGHVDRIKQIFGARDVEVLHEDSVCGDVPKTAVGRSSDGHDDLGLDIGEVEDGGFYFYNDSTVCAPWFERVHRVLARTVQSGGKFDKVVALRPDIVLVPSGRCNSIGTCSSDPSVEPPRLHLDRLCAEKPGFSFVTPSAVVRGRSYLHDRDLDFVQILCPGEELPAYEEAIRVPLEACSHGPYPALPPGFHSTRGWGGQALFCRFVQVFTDRNVPISHWDDTYALNWPSPPSGFQ